MWIRINDDEDITWTFTVERTSLEEAPEHRPGSVIYELTASQVAVARAVEKRWLALQGWLSSPGESDFPFETLEIPESSRIIAPGDPHT